VIDPVAPNGRDFQPLCSEQVQQHPNPSRLAFPMISTSPDITTIAVVPSRCDYRNRARVHNWNSARAMPSRLASSMIALT
jgi:hypothetical protein